MNVIKLNNTILNCSRLNSSGILDAKNKGPLFEKITLIKEEIGSLTLKDVMENGIISVKLYGFTGQNSAPKPSAPITIKSNKGDIKFEVSSKNLLDVKKERLVLGKYINNNGEEIGSAANFYVAQFIKVKAGGAYTASFSEDIGYFSFMEYDANFTFLKRTLYGESGKKIASCTHTMGSTTAYVVVGSNPTSAQVTEDYILSHKWMLNEGSTALSYENYKADVVYMGSDTIDVEDRDYWKTFSIEPLLSVGVYVDTQEFIKGVVTHRVGIKVFDGTERISLSSGTYNYGIADKMKSATPVLCSHYPFTSAASSAAADKTIKSYSSVNIGFKDSSFATVADFAEFLAREYAKGTPVMVVYPLIEEIEENVTPQPLINAEGTVYITRVSYGTDAVKTEATYKKKKKKKPQGNKMITFTISRESDSPSFECPEGMTWDAFCNSEYNTADLFSNGLENFIVAYSTGDDWFITDFYVYDSTKESFVLGADIIVDGMQYTCYPY